MMRLISPGDAHAWRMLPLCALYNCSHLQPSQQASDADCWAFAGELIKQEGSQGLALKLLQIVLHALNALTPAVCGSKL